MSSRRSVTRASAPLQGRAARASSRDVKKTQPAGSAASKRRQEVALPMRKAARVEAGGKKPKRRRGDDGSEEEEEEEELQEEKTVKRGKPEGRAVVERTKEEIEDARLGELLMRTVIAHEKELTSATTKKMPVWDAIAKECGSPFTTGHTAIGKAKSLLRVYRDKDHKRYETLTPTLLKLLKQYTQFMEAPQKEESDGDEEHVTMKEVVDDEAPTEEEEEEEKQQQGIKIRRVTEATITEEEELMAIVLKHAPKFASATDETEVWDAIAHESSGRFENGVAARHHYVGLMRWLNPTHYKHKVLTPMLRLQLQQLQDSDYDVPLEKSVTLKTATKKAPAPAEAVDTPQSKPPHAQPVLESKDAYEKVPAVRQPTPEEDDLLLYEIVRIRPFDHKGEATPYWEQIVAALHQRVGSNDVFPDQKVCQKRMSRLLNAVRRPKLPTTPSVTPLQLEILNVLQTILDLKYQWGAMIRMKTDEYHRIMGHLNTLLEKIKPKPATAAKPTQIPAKPTPVPVKQTQVPAKPTPAPPSRPALGELPELPADVQVRAALNPPNNKRAREENVNEERKQNEPMAEPPRAAPPPRAPVSSSNEEELQAAYRHVQSVESILASANVETLSVQAGKLERERRGHAKAFRTMVQLLQDEREQIQRETEATLAKVEKQRADRKEEFKTMINLVAHAAAQYRA